MRKRTRDQEIALTRAICDALAGEPDERELLLASADKIVLLEERVAHLTRRMMVLEPSPEPISKLPMPDGVRALLERVRYLREASGFAACTEETINEIKSHYKGEIQ